MRARKFLGGITALVTMAVVGGCTTPAPTEEVFYIAPEYCPYDSLIVQFNGDSLGAGISREVELPGYSKFEASQGASTYTIDVQVPTIATRVKQWIDQCGTPGALLVEGGIIDIVWPKPLSEIQAELTSLSDYLEARDVPTVWLGVTPFPGISDYQVHNPARIAFNDWLTTPGNLWGTGIDCTSAIADPAYPEVMAPRYWEIVDIFGTPDGLHPNHAGYVAIADCVEPHLLAALGAP